jgi:hypothetical protein
VRSDRLSISVLTTCTGVKIATGSPELTQRDFARGWSHIAAIHERLAVSLVPAEKLYRGQQHVRLMRGVEAARERGHLVSVSIVSAGYGLLGGEQAVAPYECTFQGMSVRERREWAGHLSLAESVERFLDQPADAAIVLLGDDYFTACAPTGQLPGRAPTLVLCGARMALRIQPAPNVHPVVLHESDTRRFSCGLVGLKGEVAGRLLRWLAAEPARVDELGSPRLLDELEGAPMSRSLGARA